jgi:hypothetical protein
MTNPQTNRDGKIPILPNAARFWERGRLFYNLILTAIALLWLVLSWPHFRPALSLDVLAAMGVLALLANLCYSAAHLADVSLQFVLPSAGWRRYRLALWMVGTLFAILLENYWIADEIYPSVNQGAPHFFQGTNAMWSYTIATNMNFPAPLAVLGFVAASVGLFLALASIIILWFAGKPPRKSKFARITAGVIPAVALVYFALLFGFSACSRASTLARGQEKYFCEIDCHLAYSVVDVNTQPDANSIRYKITLRTRFDETTTSPNRPKDSPLTPSPCEVHLIDSAAREYTPISTYGTLLLTPLKPSESYTTELEFIVPKDASSLKLLINTLPAWPDRVVIGDENSLLHKKTYLSL